MKTVAFKGIMRSGWGKPFAELKVKGPNGEPVEHQVKVLNYSGDFTAYQTIEEVRTALDFPKDKQIVNYRNKDRKAKARAAAMSAQLEAAGFIQPTLENDPQMRLKDAYKTFYTNALAKASAEERTSEAWLEGARERARAKAAEFLELEWDDEDEDEE